MKGIFSVIRNNHERPNRRRRLRSSLDFPDDDNDEWIPMLDSSDSDSSNSDAELLEELENVGDDDDDDAVDDDAANDDAADDDADNRNDAANNVTDNNEELERTLERFETTDTDQDDGWVTDESD